MSMTVRIKPLIFVSHASVDAAITNALKADIEQSFLGMCTLFVSSNLDSISGGSEWSTRIRESLESAVVFMGVLSPDAVQRQWIYIEFGAAWIRRIKPIIICHTGLEPHHLARPLSDFQAITLSDPDHLEHLYTEISTVLGCSKPTRDFAQDVLKYKEIADREFLKRHLLWWLERLEAWNPGAREKIFNETSDVQIPGDLDTRFRTFVHECESRGFFTFKPRGVGLGTQISFQVALWSIGPGENVLKLREALSDN